MLKESEGLGKTYDEAVTDGLTKIGLKKSQVMIEIIKEPRKTFFNILEPRQVRVKVTELEENSKVEVEPKKYEKKVFEEREYVKPSEEEIEQAKGIANDFINEVCKNLEIELDISIDYDGNFLNVKLYGEKAGLVIGYRGETLEALQVLIADVLKKTHVRVFLDVEDYRQKRAKTLEALAKKVAGNVISKRKSFTLEPMTPYERRIIHTTLQNHPKVKTESVGEEPFRKVVVSLKSSKNA